MKVIDKITGNALESSDAIVIESWKENPGRFELEENAKDGANPDGAKDGANPDGAKDGAKAAK